MEPTQKVTGPAIETAGKADSEPAGGCRWQAKSWLLTYSQSKLSKEAVRSHLTSLKPVEKLAIGEEKHQDGNTHFHAVVVYTQKTNNCNVRYWDIQGEHPNVKTLGRGQKNFVRAVKYVTKEDDSPIIEGFDLETMDQKKEGEYGLMVEALKAGAKAEEIRQKYLGTYLRCKRNVREVIQELEMDEWKKSRLSWRGVKCNVPEIQEWLNSHIKKELSNPLPQLWITGPTGVGKSSMMEFLKKYLMLYPIPTDTWLDGYENGAFDLMYIDEYRDKHYTIEKLNKLSDGHTYVFPVKGSQVVKTDPLPLIVLSNHSIDNCYQKVRDRFPQVHEALKRRFLEVYVGADVLISIEEADTEVVE